MSLSTDLSASSFLRAATERIKTMPPYGEPDWATPGSTAAAPAAAAPGVAAAPTTNGNSGEDRNKARLAISGLSFLNIGLSVMMAALGVLTLINLTDAKNSLSTAFLSAYMIVFAVILFSYEFVWWSPIPQLNKLYRKNFGFMYGLKGKGMFLIFIAFLCLGLRDNNASGVRGLDLATGIAWLATGCFSIFLSITWPETNAAYKPPTVGLESMGQEDEGNNPV